MSTVRHWANMGETGFAFGMQLLFVIYRRLGRWPFRLFLYPVVSYYYCRRHAERRASREYLQRLWQYFKRTDKPVLKGPRHFVAFAEAILDKLLAWSGDIPAEQIDFAGDDATRAAVASGRGGVIILAHLGNVELSRILGAQVPGLRLNILVHHAHAQNFNRMLARLNPQSQVNLVHVSTLTPAAAVDLAARVEQGEFVVITSDRISVAERSPVVFAPFLGQVAPFPAGPWILASILQCPVFLLWSLRVDSRFHVRFEPFCERVVLPRATRGPAVKALVSAYAVRLEQMCNLAPFQWFNFFSFWALPADSKHDVIA